MRWQVWLAGTNNFLETDDNSEIDLADLETDLQVVEEPHWIPLDIVAITKKRVAWRSGAITQAEVFPFEMEAFAFDTDEDRINAIDAMLRYRFLYLCRDGEEQEEVTKYPVTFHTALKCVQVVVEENDSAYQKEYGTIEKTIKFRRYKQIR